MRVGKIVSDPRPLTPVVLVYPIAGAALAVDQIEERTDELPDGTPITQTVESKIYRDGRGRMRIEWSIQSKPFPVIYLLDPVTRSVAILLVEAKLANRDFLPESGPGEFRVGFPTVGKRLPPGKWRSKTEPLGERMTNGFGVVGTHTTRTSEDQPQLFSSEERWVCNGLGFVSFVSASGPNWKHIVRMRNINCGEPDPALFVIPSDYAIDDSSSSTE